MNISNFRLHTRLRLGFGVLAATALGVVALALFGLDRANDDFEEFIHGINARAALASQLRAAVDTRAISARNLVLVTGRDEMDVEQVLVGQAHTNVQQTLARLKQAALAKGVSERARELIAKIDEVERAYGPIALAIVADTLAGRREAAISAMNRQCRPMLARLVEATDEYAAFSAGVAADRVRDSNHHFEAHRAVLLVAGALAVMLAMLVAWRVTRSIIHPVDQALAVAEAVARGDLTKRAEPVGKDEMARLLGALGGMSAGLETIVRQVRSGSESIATGAAEIATGNLDLSQRTEEQASALQQTAATMEQLAQTIRVNADNAQQAHQVATGSRAIADRGGSVVGEAVETMQAINRSSKKIAEITGVIDGIAFQTNILALNAAVEAARAGEQGRGFAVVAGEVRSLAQRSAEAAREIKSLIQASVEQVERGSRQVDAAGASMGEMVDAFQRVGDLVEAISTASVEQSEGAAQVGSAVSQMDRVTQQNAALVEESAAASASLKNQSQALLATVATFRLNAG